MLDATMDDSLLSQNEIAYLTDETRRLARVATIDSDGLPHVTPVGMWRYDPDTRTIEITGRRFTSTKKFRNVLANDSASIVIDDVASSDPWRPRAILIQGTAEAFTGSETTHDGYLRLTPRRVVSWGLDGSELKS